MDFRSVFDYTYDLKEELARLKEDSSVKVPSILKLVEVELTRLDNIMLSMIAAERKAYMVENELMVIEPERVSNEFGLSDASSMELLRNTLTDEYKVLDGYFKPPLFYIAHFIRTVIYSLEQKSPRVFSDEKVRAVTSAIATSQGPKLDSVGGSSAPASSTHKTGRQGSPRQDVDDEDVDNLIFRFRKVASADTEYRCYVGGLAWATDDQALERAFSQFGNVIESKIINDRETGRSRGFGFVRFGSEQAMRDAIEGLNGQDLDGRNITVNEAQSRGSGGGGGGGYSRGGRGRREGGGGGRREGGGGGDRGGSRW